MSVRSSSFLHELRAPGSFLRRRLLPAAILLILPSRAAFAAPEDVVINEISWSGTAASSSDEWIELHNPTGRDVDVSSWTLKSLDGTPSVVLIGTIPAGGYYLLERTDDASVSNVAADRFFSGALANGPPAEDLVLLDRSSQTVDEVFFSTAGWPGGTASPDFRSMERIDPLRGGSDPSNWRSNNGVTRFGLDAAGSPLNGTPRARNSVFGAADHEACGNGTDDDLNGAADCADPACLSDALCRAPDDPRRRGKPLGADPSSNPFSPRDPDPSRRAARLLFDAGAADAVKRIRVLNARGETVRTLVDNDRGADGKDWKGTPAGELLWDGADEAGRLLPMGLYVAVLESARPSGERMRGRAALAIGR